MLSSLMPTFQNDVTVDKTKTGPEQLRLKLCQNLGLQLQNKDTGDVVFAVQGMDGKRENLYAWRHVLSSTSEYFSVSKIDLKRNTES